LGAETLACKDLGLAVDVARASGVPAELSALVEQIYRRARAQYGDEAGEMVPVRLYEDLARTPLRLHQRDASELGGARRGGRAPAERRRDLVADQLE